MIIISPAKRLAERVNDHSLAPTTPHFKKEANQLAKEPRKNSQTISKHNSQTMSQNGGK